MMNIEQSAKSIIDGYPVPITEYLNHTNRITNIASEPAIYIFWYKNNSNTLKSLSRKLVMKGPSGKKHEPTTWWEAKWKWNMEQEYVCLYVGKSTDINRRLGEQLLLSTPENIYHKHAEYISEKYSKHGDHSKDMLAKPKGNTSCQFRSGFDYLYRKEEIDIFTEIRERICITTDDENDFVTRFYLEDYLIGALRPWFNLDGER